MIPEDEPVLRRVEDTLRGLFPQLDGVAITHRWGGLMGVPRHWRPCVRFDRTQGLGSAGGYVGEGVGASNLAGRIMADLILERDTPESRLAWVDDAPPRWEAEPWRWLGAKSIEFFGERADSVEFRRGRPSRLWGPLFDHLIG